MTTDQSNTPKMQKREPSFACVAKPLCPAKNVRCSKLNVSIKFLSCEPQIEDLGDMDLNGIDWVIVGDESDPKARPMRLEWVVNIKQQVELQGAASFFKQCGIWGSDGVKCNKHANGKLLLGKVIQQMPEKIAV